MLSFYKFCISRGAIMGNLLFIAVYSYIAGIVLLYQIGGIEHVTFLPHIVWQSLYYQWGAYQNQAGGDLGTQFIIALLFPLFISTAIKLCFKLISYPIRKHRNRREAMQPKPKTAEERIEELETKLSEMEGKNASTEEEAQEQEPSQGDDNIPRAKAPEISTSPAKEMESTTPSSASISNDEVIITPPPRMYDTEEDGAPQAPISQTYHPQSVDADFLKNRKKDKE